MAEKHMEVSLDDVYFAYDGSREPSVDIAFFLNPWGSRAGWPAARFYFLKVRVFRLTKIPFISSIFLSSRKKRLDTRS